MADFLRTIILFLLRLILRCRYRIRIVGLPDRHQTNPPVLILPNHPAMVDPMIMLSQLDRRFHPRTVLYDGNFPSWIRPWIVSGLNAIPIPDLSPGSEGAHQQAHEAMAEIGRTLNRGENVLLWPSGRAQRDGTEHLGAVRALSEALNAAPNATILLVRTRGLWGSMFSVAQTGRLPELGRCLLKGALLLLANGLIFAPRRKVEITFEVLDRSRLPATDRNSVNRWFEDWYNANGPESPLYVPYHFAFGSSQFEFPPLQSIGVEIDISTISKETIQTVAQILERGMEKTLDPDDLKPDVLLDDLGFDSLQRMDLALEVERKFHRVADITPETVGDLLAIAHGLTAPKPLHAPSIWFRPPQNITPLQILGETIPDAFIARALSTRDDVAAADDITGVTTYSKLIIGAIALAKLFRKIPTERLGILLPASVGCDTILFAVYFADKTPVLLNWTTGPANMAHAAKLAGLTTVITSRQMRQRLDIRIDAVQFLDVEDLGKKISKVAALTTWLSIRFFPNVLKKQLGHWNPESTAVILFTSGSEKAPKAVPLTHANIIANIRTIPAILSLTNQDAVLGFLPMFHSFGFTITGLFPLLSGIRVVHHPDPTDAGTLVRKISAYAPTVIVAMPSIVSRIFERANPNELKSVRIIALGAEKCPQELFDRVHQVVPNATILEGYGITECSPIVAANRPEAIREGSIGQPLPGVNIEVVDLETDKTLPPGQMGMLLVNGPSVFAGYLGDEKSPFVNRDGKQWYVTGDLVEIDSDGFIFFRGRLKRFIKSGGEMISLPALEEPFQLKFPSDDQGPHVAVEGIETERGKRIVLFSKNALTLEEANAILSASGFRGVMRLDEVRHVAEIPLLGTGKIDYRKLRSTIDSASQAS